jgi:hypothetical protein
LKKKAWVGAKAGVKAVYRVYSTEERDAIHSQYLTFDQVKEMWHLHKSIDYFAHRIPTSLMRSHPVVKTKGAFSITPFVRARFQRALYRLDAFVKLLQTMIATFCDDNDGENREVVDSELKEAHWIHCLKELEEHRIIKAFHCQYSAVEIEQMSSICGLLITEIAPSMFLFAFIHLTPLEKFLTAHVQLSTPLSSMISCGARNCLTTSAIPCAQEA